MKKTSLLEPIRKMCDSLSASWHLDFDYFLKGGFWISVRFFSATITGILTAVVLANLMSKTDYGTYGYVLTVLSLLVLTTLAGIDSAIISFVSEGRNINLYKLALTKIKYGFLGSIGALCISGFYFISKDNGLGFIFLLVAFFAPFVETFDIYDAALQAKKKFKLASLFYSSIQFAGCFAIITTFLITRSVTWILISYFAIFSIMRFAFFLYTKKKFYREKTKENQVFKYGFHLSIVSLVSTLGTYIDKILAFNLLGPDAMAIFLIISLPVEQIKSFFRNVMLLALPKYGEYGFGEIKARLKEHSVVMFAVCAAFVFVYVFFAPWIFEIFLSQYLRYVPLSQLLAVSILTFPVFLPHAILQSKRMTRQLYYYNVIGAAVQIGLSVAGIIFGGLLGLVIARISGRVFSEALAFILIKLDDK